MYAVRALSAGVALIAGGALVAVAGPDPLLESRVARLERVLDERNLAEIVLQLERLQQEVRELRGQLERQQYQLERLAEQRPSWRSPDVFAPRLPEADPVLAPGAAPVLGADSGSRAASVPGAASMPGAASVPRAAPPEPAAAAPPERETMPALPAAETPGGGERALYRTGFEALKARDYPAARAAFTAVLERYPQGELADNACYWLGEIAYLTQDYPTALIYFQRVTSAYPHSARVPGALLKIGYVHAEQRAWAEARAALEQVVSRFPDSTEGRLAASRLSQLLTEMPR